jgi:hypothetical protein
MGRDRAACSRGGHRRGGARAHDRARLRWDGPEAGRALDGRGRAAEFRPSRERGPLPGAADDQPGAIARRLGDVRHRAQPRRPRHLRLSEAQSRDLRAGILDLRDRAAGARDPRFRLSAAARRRNDAQPARRHAVLGQRRARRAPLVGAARAGHLPARSDLENALRHGRAGSARHPGHLHVLHDRGDRERHHGRPHRRGGAQGGAGRDHSRGPAAPLLSEARSPRGAARDRGGRGGPRPDRARRRGTRGCPRDLERLGHGRVRLRGHHGHQRARAPLPRGALPRPQALCLPDFSSTRRRPPGRSRCRPTMPPS